MPLQNRVGPDGSIIAVAARGTFMGNRGGAIHNDRREIVRPFASRRWITCVLEFRGRHRDVMSPGRYTELFFLDEAVSLAAGHRPCAECRRARFNEFKAAWIQAGISSADNFVYADEIDFALHRARIGGSREKVVWQAKLNSLPDGTFIRMRDSSYVVRGEMLFRWSPTGYVCKQERPDNLQVTVLTPEPTVACLRHGYMPEWHISLPGN